MGQRLEPRLLRCFRQVPQAKILPPAPKSFSACSTILNSAELICWYSTPLPIRNTFASSLLLRQKLANLKAFQQVSASLLDIITPIFLGLPKEPAGIAEQLELIPKTLA